MLCLLLGLYAAEPARTTAVANSFRLDLWQTPPERIAGSVREVAKSSYELAAQQLQQGQPVVTITMGDRQKWQRANFHATLDGRNDLIGSAYRQAGDKLIIVGFHGSFWGYDWIQDFNCVTKSAEVHGLEGAQVHNGFSGIVEKTYSAMLLAIANLKSAEESLNDFEFFFTGHSLGAALATLAAAEYAVKNKTVQNQVKIVGFSSPCVGDTKFKEYVHKHIGEDNIFRFSCNADLVPHALIILRKITRGSFDYRHVGRSFKIPVITHWSSKLKRACQSFGETRAQHMVQHIMSAYTTSSGISNVVATGVTDSLKGAAWKAVFLSLKMIGINHQQTTRECITEVIKQGREMQQKTLQLLEEDQEGDQVLEMAQELVDAVATAARTSEDGNIPAQQNVLADRAGEALSTHTVRESNGVLLAAQMLQTPPELVTWSKMTIGVIVAIPVIALILYNISEILKYIQESFTPTA